MKPRIIFAAAAATLALSGCSSVGGEAFGSGSEFFSLVRVREVKVGDGTVTLTPPRPWNRARRVTYLFNNVRWVEDWTLNGPGLDTITFVTGMPNGKYLIRTDRNDDRQVPKFRSNMTAPEIGAMIESMYRIYGGALDFQTLSLQPRQLFGANGFQIEYQHLDNDEVWRKGRVVGAVIDGKLYMFVYDAVRSHYYNDALPDFEAMIASARRRA